MGQIVSAAAKPKRCNLQSLSSLETPAAGEYILVSSDNSMNAAGQGNFDCYIEGDGTKAATALELKFLADKNLEEGSTNAVQGNAVYKELYGEDVTSWSVNLDSVASTSLVGINPTIKQGDEVWISIDGTFEGGRIRIMRSKNYILFDSATTQYTKGVPFKVVWSKDYEITQLQLNVVTAPTTQGSISARAYKSSAGLVERMNEATEEQIAEATGDLQQNISNLDEEINGVVSDLWAISLDSVASTSLSTLTSSINKGDEVWVLIDGTFEGGRIRIMRSSNCILFDSAVTDYTLGVPFKVTWDKDYELTQLQLTVVTAPTTQGSISARVYTKSESLVDKVDVCLEAIERIPSSIFPNIVVTTSNPYTTCKNIDGNSYVQFRLSEPTLLDNAYLCTSCVNMANVYCGFQPTERIDDVAPMHIIDGNAHGANHIIVANKATTTSHGITDALLGSIWTKDNSQAVLIGIGDSDTLFFDSITTGTWTNEETSIVVESVSSVDICGICDETKVRVRLLADGKELAIIGSTYSCQFFDVCEEYNIYNKSQLVNYISSNHEYPTDFNQFAIAKVSNVYRFQYGPTCLVLANVTFMQSTSLTDIMFSQATSLGQSETTYYVPNSLPFSNHDFRTPILSTGGTSSEFWFNSQHWRSVEHPVDRVLQWRSSMGFALGFLPYGVGKKLSDYTANTFEIRYNTGKVYPHGVEGAVVGTPTSLYDGWSAVLYRRYFAKNNDDDVRLADYCIEYDGYVYLFLDYRSSCVDKYAISDTLQGKIVECIDAHNASVSEIYDEGVKCFVNKPSSEDAFVVVRIKK